MTCHEPVLYFFQSAYERPAPGRSSLYGLDCGKSRTGPSLKLFSYNYDASRSTMTHHPYYDELQFVIQRPRLDTIRWCQSWLVRYKAMLLRGMSLECSSFVVLQSDPHSPLFSILFFLPKDQTLKRVTKHTRSRLALLNTSQTEQTTKTLGPHGLVSSWGSHKRLQTPCQPDDPVVS